MAGVPVLYVAREPLFVLCGIVNFVASTHIFFYQGPYFNGKNQLVIEIKKIIHYQTIRWWHE